MSFYVYAIMFDDQHVFGLYATREAAEDDLRRQIAEGGPAWPGSEVVPWKVDGDPEMHSSDKDSA